MCYDYRLAKWFRLSDDGILMIWIGSMKPDFDYLIGSNVVTPLSNPLSRFIRELAVDRPISEVLADILRNKIINGELLPGSRLVEAELSKLYGVSRGSIREALR